MAKMNPEIKAKWLEALRSGEYAQTKYRLQDEVGYCCLGVLCDIVDPEGWGDAQSPEIGLGAFCQTAYKHRGKEEVPGNEIAGWAGLGHSDVDVLAEMNDAGGKTFVEIAKYVEEAL